ncbi:hypothetical protein Tco_1185351 [Tanacetum coccineum]
MDLEQNNSLAKLPLLKQGEYDTWRLRIESYIQLQDYSLWEIIEAGTLPASSTNYYRGKCASSSESLDSIFNRLQKIVSQLTILGEIITPEELNLKFLRSLPTEWGMHVVVWRNKSDLGSISFDDLYNNFKIVEPEVKRSVTSSSNSGSQNLAFVSGHSSTNDDNIANVHVSTGSSPVSTASTNNSTACLSDATVYAYLATQPNGSQVVHEDLEQIHEDDLDEMDLKWQLALLSMKARKFYQRTGKKIVINGRDTAGYDKKKVRKSESDLSNYKRGLASIEERLVFYKKNESMLNDQIAVLKRDASYKDSDINGLEKQVERLKKEKEENQFKIDNYENASKSLDQMIRNQLVGNNKKGLGYNIVPPLLTGLFAPHSVDLSSLGIEKFKEPEFEGYGVKIRSLIVVLESLNVQKPKQADQPIEKAKDSKVCKITRADGTSSFHRDFQALLRRLDRQDLFQRYSFDGTSIQINMLVDKKYPLKKEILKKMINLKIEAEEESNMASELIISLARKEDTRDSFNELMDTPLDFSAFVMNRLKVDTLTPELLAGPTLKLMKGLCKSLVELEYFLKEVYKATTDNPEGQQYQHDPRKPLPLIPNSQGRCIIPFDHFINNDLEYLRGVLCQLSTTNMYYEESLIGVESIRDSMVLSQRRESTNSVINDDKLYTFKEGDYKRLRLQDIEDMLLLLVQGKLTNLTIEERLALNVSLRMFTRSIVIQRRVEDL